jgi:SPP1 family predicted phage head-tail adaptor
MSSAASVRSGELRNKIQFMENAGERVSGGSVPPAWVPTGNPARCKVDPLSGSKLFLAMQSQARVTHEITMRYRGGINPHWRIKFGTELMEIVSIVNVEQRNRKLVIMAASIT